MSTTSNGTRAVRPQYRNIHVTQIVAYRLPLAGITSILHRISGGLLFLLLPLVLWLLDRSITSEVSFDTFKAVTSHWFAKLVILALAWAYLQHFFAGIRHLFMDLHLGVDKDSGRRSAAAVIVGTGVVWLAIAAKVVGLY